jgi:hypothetical protein
VEIHFLKEKSIKRFEISDKFIFEITNKTFNLKIDLNTGMVNFKFLDSPSRSSNLEIASMLAVVSSISAIHVLLEPKKMPKKNL